jgi:hypothetical protein
MEIEVKMTSYNIIKNAAYYYKMAAYYYKMSYDNMFPGQQFSSVCRPTPQEACYLGFIKPQMNLRIYHKFVKIFRNIKIFRK